MKYFFLMMIILAKHVNGKKCYSETQACPSDFTMVTDAEGSTCLEVTNSGVYHFSESQQVCALKSSRLPIINSTTRLNTFSAFLLSEGSGGVYFHTSGTQDPDETDVDAGWTWHDGSGMNLSSLGAAITTPPTYAINDGNEDCLYMTNIAGVAGLVDYDCDNSAQVVCESLPMPAAIFTYLSAVFPTITSRCWQTHYELFSYPDDRFGEPGREVCLFATNQTASNLTHANEICDVYSTGVSTSRVVSPYFDPTSQILNDLRTENIALASFLLPKLGVNAKYWLNVYQPSGATQTDHAEGWYIHNIETLSYVDIGEAVPSDMWTDTDPESSYLGQDYIHAMAGGGGSWMDVSNGAGGLEVICEADVVTVQAEVSTTTCGSGTSEVSSECQISCSRRLDEPDFREPVSA